MATTMETSGARTGFWVRNARPLKTIFRLLLGVAWLVDGVLKFTSGYVGNFLSDVQASQSTAPGWLSGWYSFWAAQATTNSSLIVYTVGTLEITLGIALVFGLLRKIAYSGGVVLSLLIWAVPEGFGGSYASGSGTTDIGTGIIYAIAFLGLIVVNATYGPSRWSLDYYIERWLPAWSRLAEFGQPVPPPAATPGASSTATSPSP
ncbi:MAG: DoxX family protein [Thermoplasmata archaeon]